MPDPYDPEEEAHKGRYETPHQHKYFAFQVKSEFEPSKLKDPRHPELILWEKKDYVYSNCNCGTAAVKVEALND